MKTNNCLICVDLQNDFCDGGSLSVPGAEKIMPVINDLLTKFDLIIFTKDWHPARHKSFASHYKGKQPFDIIDLNGSPQTLWPDHCIKHTRGADIHKDVMFNKINKDANFYFFKKGLDREVDSYSAFYDNEKKNSTGLGDFLKEKNVSNVYIAGLALDYCVKFTAIDSKSLGFNTMIIDNACKGISSDVQKIYKELKDIGINIINSTKI